MSLLQAEIYAFDAAADGKLTKVPGSPFAASTDIGNPGMVVNGRYLFIIGDDPTPVGGDASYETNVETWRWRLTVLSRKWERPTSLFGRGLQVFHFNGASPITPFTGVLNADGFYKFFWDNANHLYAIDESAGNLHVYTITPTSAVEAPGSPYVIPGIDFGGGQRNLAVQTLPRFKP